MLGSIAFVLLGAAAATATPCENLASLKLADMTITSAVVVPEGPPPARGGGGGAGARGGTRGGGAPQAQGAVPQVGQQSGTRGGTPPANIPAHCRVQMVLKPTSDSMINMELWLPTENWN